MVLSTWFIFWQASELDDVDEEQKQKFEEEAEKFQDESAPVTDLG